MTTEHEADTDIDIKVIDSGRYSLSSSPEESSSLSSSIMNIDVDNADIDTNLEKAVNLVSMGPAWFSNFGSKSISDQHYPHELQIELYRTQVEYFPESFPEEWTELHPDQQDMILYSYFPNDQIRGKFFAILQDILGAPDTAREAIVKYIDAVIQAMLRRLEVMWTEDDSVKESGLILMAQSQRHPTCAGMERQPDSRGNDKHDQINKMQQSDIPQPHIGPSGRMQQMVSSSRAAGDEHKLLEESDDLMVCIPALNKLCSRIATKGMGDSEDSDESVLKYSQIMDRVNEMEMYLRNQLKVLEDFRKDMLGKQEARATKGADKSAGVGSCHAAPCRLSPLKRMRIVSAASQTDVSLRSPKKQARGSTMEEDDYDEGVAMGVDGDSPFRNRSRNVAGSEAHW